MNLARIPAFADGDVVHVIVETPRGSGLKLKYEQRWETFGVSRPLPLGTVYPFDWGFVPSTRGPDGDPVDAMLLWDVASAPGVVVACRVIGALQVEQVHKNGDRAERIRNDRIMAVPLEARREHDLATVAALSERVRAELEQFAMTAAALEGKDVRVVGWTDAPWALQLVRERVTHP